MYLWPIIVALKQKGVRSGTTLYLNIDLVLVLVSAIFLKIRAILEAAIIAMGEF